MWCEAIANPTTGLNVDRPSWVQTDKSPSNP